MRERLLFIYNPNAGKAKLKGKLSDIVVEFSENGYEVIVMPTTKHGDATEFAKEYAKDGTCSRIVCAGGDGTLNEVVTGVMESGRRIPIGYIPAGTTNDFGYSLKIPKDAIEAAKFAALTDPLPSDVGEICGNTFVYTAAFGLFSEVSYDTSQDMKNILGRVAYLLRGVRSLVEVQNYQLEVEYLEAEEDGTEAGDVPAGGDNAPEGGAFSVAGSDTFVSRSLALQGAVLGDGAPEIEAGGSASGDDMPEIRAEVIPGEAFPEAGRDILIGRSFDLRDADVVSGASVPVVGDGMSEFGANAPVTGDSMSEFGANAPVVGDGIPEIGANASMVGDGMPEIGANVPVTGDSMPETGAGVSGNENDMPGAKSQVLIRGNGTPELGENTLVSGSGLAGAKDMPLGTAKLPKSGNWRQVTGEFICGMVANSNSVGGFKGIMGKGVRFDDGVFEMLLIRRPRNVIELTDIVNELVSKKLKSDNIVYAHVREVRLEAKSGLPWSLDGEFGGDMPQATIHIRQQAVDYIRKETE